MSLIVQCILFDNKGCLKRDLITYYACKIIIDHIFKNSPSLNEQPH